MGREKEKIRKDSENEDQERKEQTEQGWAGLKKNLPVWNGNRCLSEKGVKKCQRQFSVGDFIAQFKPLCLLQRASEVRYLSWLPRSKRIIYIIFRQQNRKTF